MSKLLIIFFLSLLPFCLSAGIRLHYLPNIPVLQTSNITVDVHESMPVLNLTSTTNQMAKSELVAIQGESQSPAAAPAGVIFCLKDIFIDLGINNEHATFDPRTHKGAVPLMQLSRLISRPIHFLINQEGILVPDSQQIKGLMKELPALKEIGFESMLHEFLFSIFALVGKDLKLGSTFIQKPSWKSSKTFPDEITYKIVRITDQEIVASIEGICVPLKTVLEKKINIGKEAVDVEMEAYGAFSGEVSWNRGNAMLYQMQTKYICNAQLQADKMHWGMNINISQQVTTSLSK